MDAGQAYRLIYSGVFVLIGILLVYYLISYFFFSDPYAGVRILDGTAYGPDGTEINNGKKVNALQKDLELKQGGSYSISFWLYLNGWNTDSDKVIFTKGMGSGDLTVSMDRMQNNLEVSIPTLEEPLQMYVGNVDLQRWVHFIIQVNSNFVDIYYNGQLVQSRELNGSLVVGSAGSNPFNLFPTNNFPGYLTKLRLYRTALTPDDIYSIYQDGPRTTTIFGTIFPGLQDVVFHYKTTTGDEKSLSLFN